MSSTLIITTLLSIVGFIGALMVQQLMKIANAVQNIQIELKGLATDHTNLKESHCELKERVKVIENSI